MSSDHRISVKKLFILLFLLSYIFTNTQIIFPSVLQTILTTACICLFIYYLIEYKYSIKELSIYMFILFLGLMSYVLTGMSAFLLILLSMVMVKLNDVETIARSLLGMRMIALLILIIGCLVGFISNERVSVYKSGVYVEKFALGFNHPNQLGQALGIMILLFIAITSEKKYLFNKIITGILILIAYAISGSRSMLAICGIYWILSIITIISKKKDLLSIIIIKSRWFIMALILFVGIGMPILMTHLTGQALKYLYALNGLLGSRFSYSSAVMNNYKVSLFGNVFDFSYLETLYGDYAVDNGYIYILYGFGIIAFIIFVFFSMNAVKCLAQSRKNMYALLILVLCLWGCIENILFIPTINIGVLYLGVGIGKENIKKKQKRKFKFVIK